MRPCATFASHHRTRRLIPRCRMKRCEAPTGAVQRMSAQASGQSNTATVSAGRTAAATSARSGRSPRSPTLRRTSPPTPRSLSAAASLRVRRSGGAVRSAGSRGSGRRRRGRRRPSQRIAIPRSGLNRGRLGTSARGTWAFVRRGSRGKRWPRGGRRTRTRHSAGVPAALAESTSARPAII